MTAVCKTQTSESFITINKHGLLIYSTISYCCCLEHTLHLNVFSDFTATSVMCMNEKCSADPRSKGGIKWYTNHRRKKYLQSLCNLGLEKAGVRKLMNEQICRYMLMWVGLTSKGSSWLGLLMMMMMMIKVCYSVEVTNFQLYIGIWILTNQNEVWSFFSFRLLYFL